jgi:hypothetical protein
MSSPAAAIRSSVARWLVAPMPADEKFTCPGRARTNARNSWIVFTGTEGCTQTDCAVRATSDTPVKAARLS